MKTFIAVASIAFALVALSYSQEDPEKRRQDLVDTLWNTTSENGCFTREGMQDTFAVMDEDGNNQVSKEEYIAYVGGALGDKPATCMWGKSSAAGGDPITIPDGVNKVFEQYKPNGDCVSEKNFKDRQMTILRECRWPEDENGQL